MWFCMRLFHRLETELSKGKCVEQTLVQESLVQAPARTLINSGTLSMSLKLFTFGSRFPHLYNEYNNNIYSKVLLLTFTFTTSY